jgi:ABC-type branched-subunit amino acid transport system substrate-binding protein
VLIVFCCLFITGHSSGNLYGNNPDTIKIGLLVQDKGSYDAINGAALAIASANKLTGKSGIFFQIEARSMEGPWGTGAKETVDLVFKNASVLIVSADGRNSHLAEQVSAKTQVPLISVKSSDPTLAQAFIPWFFSCVPDDNTQSEILLNTIIERKYKKPLVISENSYDSKMQTAAILKTANKMNCTISHFCRDDYHENTELIMSIKINNPDCIVLFMNPASSAAIVLELTRNSVKPALFGSLSFCIEKISEDQLLLFEGMTLVSPGYLFSMEGREFTVVYNKIYGTNPCFSAAVSYDAVKALINCFMSSPAGSPGLKEKLAQTSMEGITGNFGFDIMGNRTGKIELMKVKGGHFVQY